MRAVIVTQSSGRFFGPPGSNIVWLWMRIVQTWIVQLIFIVLYSVSVNASLNCQGAWVQSAVPWSLVAFLQIGYVCLISDVSEAYIVMKDEFHALHPVHLLSTCLFRVYQIYIISVVMSITWMHVLCFWLQGYSSAGSCTDNGCHASEGELTIFVWWFYDLILQ